MADCRIDEGGVIIFPLGRAESAVKNCLKTIRAPIDWRLIAKWLNKDTKWRGKEPARVLLDLASKGTLIAWGAKRKSFLRKTHADCTEKLIEAFMKGASVPKGWKVIFFKKNRLLCEADLVGIIHSPKLSEILWGDSGWLYVFFGKRSGCADMLDDSCNPISSNVGLDFVSIARDLLGWRAAQPFLRRVVVKPGVDLSVASSNTADRLAVESKGAMEVSSFRIADSCLSLAQVLGEKTVKLAERLLQSRHSLLLYGPPGTGKTALALCLAERMGAIAYVITGHSWMTRHTVIGGYVLSGASLEWRDGIVLRAAREAADRRKAVVILDEINRAEPERVLGELFTALSRRDLMLEVPETGESVYLGNVYIVATANTVDAVALGRIGAALHRRFAVLRLKPGKVDDSGLLNMVVKALGGDECAVRVATASVEMWKTVLNELDDDERAPGWGYALDTAKILHALVCGDGDFAVDEACRIVADSTYKNYVGSMIVSDVESVIGKAVGVCVNVLGEHR